LDRLPRGRLPAVLLPAGDPAADAVADVVAVGMEVDPAGFLQGVQRLDRRHQLHSIVGGMRLATRHFLHLAIEAQHRAPAAGSGIARAGAVREDLDLLHAGSPYSAAERIAR